MRIGELARRAGMRASAIRYYERLGLLAAPERVSGWRRYDERALTRLEFLWLARANGFALRELKQLATGRPYSVRMRELAGEKLAELDRTIERARAMRELLRGAMRCRCVTLEECGRRLEVARRRRSPRA